MDEEFLGIRMDGNTILCFHPRILATSMFQGLKHSRQNTRHHKSKPRTLREKYQLWPKTALLKAGNMA